MTPAAGGNGAWIRMERTVPRSERMQMQPYQWDPNRIARGRDHWAQYVGRRGATREDFYQAKIENDGLAILPDWSKPFGKIKGKPVEAWVQHNRWVATCQACAGQECVDPDDPVFFCWGCGNALNDGRPRPVDFGEDAFDVEEVLLNRHDPRHRIWDRHGQLTGRAERLEDLVSESEEHGDRVPREIKAKLRSQGRLARER